MSRLVLLIALVGVAAVFGCSSKPAGGGCGCKAKARGVLKLDGDSAVDEDFGYVQGLSLWANPKPPATVSLKEAHDPNFHFERCCAGRGLSSACQARCNFETYNQDLLQKMLIGADECPLDSLPEMHFCAAQGRDHTTCCQARGVDSTVAGDKCLVFCDQVPDKFTPIDYTYAACFGKFDEMKQCFHGTIASKAKAFFRHH
ncbi:hypothetical protein PENTCL1PPCAC_14491 [Pristionchus entomophagus]|uniref:Domain of unknown function DB domain-containing protein n=1 Tax=Pristionchus entomophagus TaxID=358040 RepID=A0AAV5TGM9_9BILA|nr:hypothetical protein PENTCL1PPCAC_14490 [Pristionchus entomophagus]GMS92316.1 hypothetical protein PENTCL1PPCAC_14491 [Pristionchus entomophagus]